MAVRNTNYTKAEVDKIIQAAHTETITKSQEKLLEIRDKIYLFNGIDKDSIIRMTKNVNFKRCKRGDVIMQEGDEGEDIYFILSGLAVVVVAKNKIVAKIEAGNMFGEMAFLTKKPRSATILAHSEGTVIISFQIDEAKCNDIFSYPFAFLYKNIALDLTKKLELSNKK